MIICQLFGSLTETCFFFWEWTEQDVHHENPATTLQLKPFTGCMRISCPAGRALLLVTTHSCSALSKRISVCLIIDTLFACSRYTRTRTG
ncbi:uncharacterized protein H6S33_003900 [Morchella sextelata]|uniref:uncharacterized protein n=1 Tax=Morchella sextelata TaxID=1174677 RepID=UPI001D058E4C|nr:uncharacterized protein H6S33_003900 [Morchella sextelata]KAH0606239.1 hypothetical protein H6S33_003900 [Morchella sextelata]